MTKLDLQTIGLITTFEKVTRVHVKNVYIDKRKQVIFFVNEGDAGKAIGKSGANIRKLTHLTKKKIKVIEYNAEVKEFVKNCIAPAKVDAIKVEDNKITLQANDRQIRAQLIGRGKENLEELNKLVKRYFDVEITVEQ